MCQYSLGLVARTPIFGLAGYTRVRGRRHPRSRTSLLHVETEAKTLPMRWAYRASVAIGMCRYRLLVIISLIVEISPGVSCAGEVRGQLERSSRPHSGSARFHAR